MYGTLFSLDKALLSLVNLSKKLIWLSMAAFKSTSESPINKDCPFSILFEFNSVLIASTLDISAP